MPMSTYERDVAADKLGGNHICGDNVRGDGFEELGYWDAGKLEDERTHCEAHGIALDLLTLPLNSVNVNRVALPNSIHAAAERDAETDRLIKCICAAARAGIPAVKFNFTVGGVRTEPAVGRVGAVPAPARRGRG